MNRLRIGLWVLGAGIIAMVTALSLLPIRGPDLGIEHADKWQHALAYICLTVYFAQLLPPSARARGLLALLLLAYGIGIELLQSVLPPRSAELADVLANALGIVVGQVLVLTPLGRVLARLEARSAQTQSDPRAGERL